MPFRHSLALLCLILVLAGCAPAAAPAPEAVARAAAPTSAPTAPALVATASPVPTAEPTAVPTAEPTIVVPSPSPAPRVPRVGVQVGHWKLEELPAELSKLRKASGSYYGGYDEWELNILIAEAVQHQLEEAGVAVDLLPASVPAGYEADAFLSIHADGATGDAASIRRGWKIATPWRPSPASSALEAAITESYGQVTGMPQDTRGPSIDMRGYYAFAWYRYHNAIAASTPAVIIETGFMTHPADRKLLFDQPDLVGKAIVDGVLTYLQTFDPEDQAARQIEDFPLLAPDASGLALLQRPSASAGKVLSLGRGEQLIPLSRIEGWWLVTTRVDWDIGWVRDEDVVALDEPLVGP